MTSRILLSIAVIGILFGGLTLSDRMEAAETVVSNFVDADTWITFESDRASRADEVHGNDGDMRVRSGNNSLTNAVRKPIIRFDITGQTINPAALYFFEVTTESDGTSSSTHTINAITDPLSQNFIEFNVDPNGDNIDSLTWNNASPCAGYQDCEVASGNEQRTTWNAAGPAVGNFSAPGAPDTAIKSVMLGSNLVDAVFSDGGSSLITFGIGGSNNSTLELQSKESTFGSMSPARLLTFDLFESVSSGLLTAGSTWTGGLPPSAGNQYVVSNGDIVEADGSAFNGEALGIANGSLNYSASGVNLPFVIVAAGSTVTESTTGEFSLGDFLAVPLGQMILNGELTITAENGNDSFLDMEMRGAGTIVVNHPAGGTLQLESLGLFDGVLQFNGSGDEVRYEGPPGSDMILEMNSTGNNTLTMRPSGNGGTIDNVIFNQPGVMDHRTEDALGQPRLIQPGALTANATVTINLNRTFATNERRFLFGPGLSGSGSILVNGTADDPTDPNNNISLNEFETGGSSEDTDDTHMETQSYTGTITAGKYVNVEIRRHLPGGAIVINQNAKLDMGWDEATNITSTRIGEVTINSGGTMVVGFEHLGDGNSQDGLVGHVPFNLQLTTQQGRSGDLTLAASSTTVMQISGETDPNTGMNLFDSISVEGTATLGGTLEVLINPTLTDFYNTTDPNTSVVTPNFAYVPTDGDMFEIISVVAETLVTDVDGNGSVGSEDIAIWEELYGQTLAAGDNQDFDVTADVDGNGVTDGFDFLAIQADFGASGTLTGSIAGDFASMSIIDPGGVLAGFTVSRVVTATSVTLMITANALSAVPEPSGFLLAGIAVALGMGGRGWGSPRTARK